MEFSQRLRTVRKRKQVSIAHAAEKIGVSKNTLMSYEQGHSNPKSPTMQAIAEFYGVSMDWLMGHSNGLDYGLFSNHRVGQLNQAYFPHHHTDKQPGVVLYDDYKLYYAPLIKEIREGNDLLDKDNIEDYFCVDVTLVGLKINDTAFLYRLNSNNMAPKYSPGDIVLIQRQYKIKDGEVAILLVKDEVKVNLFHHSDHYAFLENINPHYKLEKVLNTAVKIIGRVVLRIGK